MLMHSIRRAVFLLCCFWVGCCCFCVSICYHTTSHFSSRMSCSLMKYGIIKCRIVKISPLLIDIKYVVTKLFNRILTFESSSSPRPKSSSPSCKTNTFPITFKMNRYNCLITFYSVKQSFVDKIKST